MPGPQMRANIIVDREEMVQKKTITVICTDPDATDSSGDEACDTVPAFKKKKRLVREIFLPLAAIASSDSEKRHSSSFSSAAASPSSVLRVSKQTAMKSNRKHLKSFRRSSKPKSTHRPHRRGKYLQEIEMPYCSSIDESMETNGVFDRLSDAVNNSVSSSSEDDDAALLAFVSDIVSNDENGHFLDDSLPPSFSSSSSSSSSSTEFFSSTGLISSQKPMDMGFSMFEEGYCGPLAAELSQILDHMMIPTQELNRKLPDFVFDIFDPNNGAGGDLSDLSFDLDCESMAWVNISEGCIV